MREINKLLAMNGDYSGCSEAKDVVSPQDMLLWEAAPFDPNYHNALWRNARQMD